MGTSLAPGQCLKLYKSREVLAATDGWDPARRLGEQHDAPDSTSTHRAGGSNLIDVYEGTLLGEHVAIKRFRLPEDLMGVDAHRAAFLREAEILQQISHPHLLPILGIVYDPFQCCIVTPFMADSAYTRLFCGGDEVMPAAERLDVCILAGQALDYLHTRARPIVHRNFTARSVLLDSIHGGPLTILWPRFQGFLCPSQNAHASNHLFRLHSVSSPRRREAFKLFFCDSREGKHIARVGNREFDCSAQRCQT